LHSNVLILSSKPHFDYSTFTEAEKRLGSLSSTKRKHPQKQNCFAMHTASTRRWLPSLVLLLSFLCLHLTVFSQTGNLSGKVTDQSGNPLAGATVRIKDANKTTTTNEQGTFTFNHAPTAGILIVSYVGQTTTETKFDAGQDVNVSMKEATNATDEVVVTGVFDKRTKLQSSVAISTLNSQRISQLAPTSAADLLRNVPGIYVNNARGEISNTVYSRGISANSIDNAAGYYYVSMQEDGLPVTTAAANADFFLRADITTARLEAVRGGTASIFGANAPGGIFNYISKTGGPTFQGEARAKFGLEANGKNPYYRTDINIGGPFKKGGSVSYNIGGFFRLSQGPRYPGYWGNNGGQLKATVVKTYAAGSLKIYGKWLDDRNAAAEFIPSQDWNNPHVMAGLSTTDSYWLPALSMQIPVNNTGYTTFNAKDKAHSQDKALGMSWNHNLGNGWSFRNDGRYSNKQAISNVPAVVTPFSTTSPVFYGLPCLLQTGKFGTYSFTDKITGQQLGTVTVAPGPNGLNFIPGANNNFPGANIQPNSLFFLPLFYSDYTYKELMDQFSFSKKLKNMAFNFGGFFANSKITRIGGQEDDGVGVGTMQDKPHLVDIKLHGLFDGRNYQITDPNGFMDVGRGGITTSEGTKRQLALFFGQNWDITSRLNLDWGLRYETTHFFGSNTPVIRDPKQNDPSWGGRDNNPLTVYDNGGGIAGAPLPFDAIINTVSYSAGLNYKINNEMAVYARYSNGNKAPEIGNYFAATNTFLIKSLNSEAQNIKQVEAAFKLKNKRTALTVTPFYSLLSHVPNLQFAFQDSLSNNYNPPTQYGKYRTYGVELEGGYAFSSKFSISAQATVQNSKAVEFSTWISSGKAQQYDQLVSYSGNETDNNAQLIFSISPAYTSGKFNALVNYYYMGSRQANIPNAFKLPAFGQVDVSLVYDLSKRFRLQANINNLLNKYGILGWSGPGGFPAALNRQGFTKEFVQANPAAVFATQGSMPRAYFLTASVKF
jgi:outer membrane receptor protein involved in Fe transport